jgi:hypothetical protein
MPNTVTIARLRPTVADYFGEAATDTAFRAARIAGQIPAGRAGRGGCGSAALLVHQVLLVLLALASGAQPKDGAAAAERIAAFQLLRHDDSNRGDPIRTPYKGQPVALIDFMVGEVERCDDDRPPSSWAISAAGACQAATERRVFGASLDTLADPSDYPSDSVLRSCILPARLFGDIAALFARKSDHAEAAD